MKPVFFNLSNLNPANKFISESKGKYKNEMSIAAMVMPQPDDSYDGMTVVAILEDADVEWIGEHNDEHVEHFTKGMKLVLSDDIAYDKDNPIITDFSRYPTSNQDEIDSALMDVFAEAYGSEKVPVKEDGWSMLAYLNQGKYDGSDCCDMYICSDKKGNFGIIICDDYAHADPTQMYACTSEHIKAIVDFDKGRANIIEVFDDKGLDAAVHGDYSVNYDENGLVASSNGYWNLSEGGDFGNGLHFTKNMSIPVVINGYNGNPELCHISFTDNYDIPLRGNYKDDHIQHAIKNDEFIVAIVDSGSNVSPKPLYDVLEPVSAGKAKLNSIMAKQDQNDGSEGPTGPTGPV